MDVLLAVGVGYYDLPISRMFIGETNFETFDGFLNYSLFNPGVNVSSHQAHKCWYNAPEVGYTDSSSGLRLTAGAYGTKYMSGSRYVISGQQITIPIGSGSPPADWEVGNKVSITTPNIPFTVTNNAVIHIDNKEQRIMKDIDHKLSHDIVATAVAHNVKTIKLEQLQNIRSTTRTSRKNNRSLHNWSFYRLVQYIKYKAKLAGIEVLYVNPAYTSQRCPVCGDVHHANDRNYVCECGYHIHRDVLGATNICNSTEYVGDSNIRRTA